MLNSPGELSHEPALSRSSASLAYGMSLYDVTAVMAGVFVIAVMGIGVAADILRAEATK